MARWLFALLLLASGPVLAGEGMADPGPEPMDTQADLLALGVGYYDILENTPRNEAIDFRVEYRFGSSLWAATEPYLFIRPFVGAEATSDGGLYGLGGLVFDVPLGDHLAFSPSFGAGVYHDGDGKNLGSWVEFRSTAELAWRFADQSRVSVAFGHISNAGLTERNPGSEILTLYYQLPISHLFTE